MPKKTQAAEQASTVAPVATVPVSPTGRADSAAAAFSFAGDDARVSVTVVCLMTGMSKSWIHDAVKDGTFPAPVMRQPRCTRWRVGDVLAWLRPAGTTAAAGQVAA